MRRVISDENGVQLASRNTSDGTFRGVNLEGASLVGALLTDECFAEARFHRANLGLTVATSCDFSNADMRGVSLVDGVFRDCNFYRTNLGVDGSGNRATSLCGADFTGSSFVGANLVGATFDDRTIFPSGFDPDTEEMVRIPKD